MNVPSVVDNQQHRLSENNVLERGGGPGDIATAYFAISGYQLLRERTELGSLCVHRTTRP